MVMITVDVTREHICDGRSGDACECPVALALKSIFPYAQRVTVGRNILMVKHYRRIYFTFYVMPQSVQDFILAFDGGGSGPLAPFSFELVKEV
jgi:hypothetical protein